MDESSALTDCKRSGLQEIRAAPEGVARSVIDHDLDPHRGRGGVAEPEFKRNHRTEIAGRTVGRAVAASAAAVQRRRGGTRTVHVREPGSGRPVETDPGPQVEAAGRDGRGGVAEPRRRCEPQYEGGEEGPGSRE